MTKEKTDVNVGCYWSVHLSCSWGGDGIKGVVGVIVIFASYKFHFIRVHDNLV